MKRIFTQRWAKVQKWVWIAFLLSLPVTSFPYLPAALGGTAHVRPLAIYPLILLAVLVTLPHLVRRPLPKTFLPLLVFFMVVIASSALALNRGVEDFRGITILDRTIRNLITLALGSAYYFTTALYPKDQDELESTLRWLYIGFGIALLWGALQAVYVLRFSRPYFELLGEIQQFISTRRLFTKRVSGMTFEPNWFAEQIVTLVLPWVFAAVAARRTVFRWRWRWLTVEHGLLVLAVGVLVFTYSRAGLAIMIGLLVLSVITYHPARRKTPNETKPSRKRNWKNWATRLGLAVGLVAVLGALVFFAGTRNRYFARMWNYWSDTDRMGDYWSYIAFGQRFLYLNTAFEIFEAYPVAGVGLGNFAFYFDEMMPDQPLYHYPELIRFLSPWEENTQLLTPKNLFARLLAETGVVGFGIFLSFLLMVLGEAFTLWSAPDQNQQYWGKAGILGLAAVFLIAFSSDSFATPNTWVVLGLITASTHIYTSGEPLRPINMGNDLITEPAAPSEDRQADPAPAQIRAEIQASQSKRLQHKIQSFPADSR